MTFWQSTVTFTAAAVAFVALALAGIGIFWRLEDRRSRMEAFDRHADQAIELLRDRPEYRARMLQAAYDAEFDALVDAHHKRERAS